jgi:hypothetical protein
VLCKKVAQPTAREESTTCSADVNELLRVQPKEKTMTDRELLEAAAKAAGLEPGRWRELPHQCLTLLDAEGEIVNAGWNPLQDDGDALRLAVKLRLVVSIEPTDTAVGLPDGRGILPDGRDLLMTHEPHQADAAAATRRAIVRAAAALGEKR